MNSAIELVVAAYVETNQLSALQDLRQHRATLAASIRDRSDYNFGVLLGQLEDDVRAIDAGIRQLRTASEARPAADV